MALPALLLAAAAAAAPGSDPGPHYDRAEYVGPVRVPVFRGAWAGVVRTADGKDETLAIGFRAEYLNMTRGRGCTGQWAVRLLASGDGTLRLLDDEDHCRPGIFVWEGRRVKVCIGPVDEPRPTDFRPARGRCVWVIEKVNDDDD